MTVGHRRADLRVSDVVLCARAGLIEQIGIPRALSAD